MARVSKYEPLYQAFQQFLEQCVRDDSSLLWPTERAWTPEVVADIIRRMIVETPMPGGDLRFEEKLQVQMQGASRQHWMVIADLYYVYFLPSSFLTEAKRFKDIRWAAQQAGVTPPPETAPAPPRPPR